MASTSTDDSTTGMTSHLPFRRRSGVMSSRMPRRSGARQNLWTRAGIDIAAHERDGRTGWLAQAVCWLLAVGCGLGDRQPDVFRVFPSSEPDRRRISEVRGVFFVEASPKEERCED